MNRHQTYYEKRIHKLQDLLAQRDKQLEVIYGSNSWRLTAPLRWLGRLVKKVLKTQSTHSLVVAPSLKDCDTPLREFDSSLTLSSPVSLLTRDVLFQPGQPQLYQRLATLAKGKVHVAYFAENVHSSTFRYRAANMAEVLNAAEPTNNQDTSAACFFSSDLHSYADIVKSADILVISRARYDLDIAQLIHQFKTQDKKVWFDIDDWVFDIQQIDLIISTQGQEPTDEVLNYWYAVISRMMRTMCLCDGVITTNSYLANKISKFIDIPVKTIPNFANVQQLEVSQPIYERKLTQKSNANETIKLGYFSGSASHNRDLALILPALERLMLRDPRVELVLVGPVELEEGLKMRFNDRIKRHDFVDYLKLQELIGSVDFNLVPLQVNDFTHCKSELKFVDAAIVGTLTIASPAFSYAEVIRHSENGYLAEDDQWETVLLQAIVVRDTDLEQHKRMTAAAYKDVQQRFTWQTQCATILEALELT
jgi:glycosyltransferase involved in cell wall biosynthesis